MGGLSLYKSSYASNFNSITEAPIGKEASTSISNFAIREVAHSNGNSNDIVAAIANFNKLKCLKDQISFECSGSSTSSSTDASDKNLESDYCIDPKSYSSSGYSSRYSTVDDAKFTTGSKKDCQNSLDLAIQMIQDYGSKMSLLSSKVDDVYSNENTIISSLNSQQANVDAVSADSKISPVLAVQGKYPGAGIESVTNCDFAKRPTIALENYLCFETFNYYYYHAAISFILSWFIFVIGCLVWFAVY